jgi:hypothetical protein
LRAYSFIPYYFVHSKHRSTEDLLVFGASWDTGVFPYSQVRKMGAKVIAVFKDNSIKTEFGADLL